MPPCAPLTFTPEEQVRSHAFKVFTKKKKLCFLIHSPLYLFNHVIHKYRYSVYSTHCLCICILCQPPLEVPSQVYTLLLGFMKSFNVWVRTLLQLRNRKGVTVNYLAWRELFLTRCQMSQIKSLGIAVQIIHIYENMRVSAKSRNKIYNIKIFISRML